jgi:N-formylglutamate amidohydrolase
VPYTILHIPHNSTVIPSDIRPTLFLSDEELELELVAMTDHDTAELFDLGEFAQRIIYPVSRLVTDPERFVDDAQEIMATRGMGVIYTLTSMGKPLRLAPSVENRQALIARFYTPHHLALTAAVDAALSEHGYCLVLDGHSFPSHPLPLELDQTPDRPDICIGTDSSHTPMWLTELSCDLFRAQGFVAKVNQPYSGTMVPGKYWGVTPAVLSLMIEVNRGLYMDEFLGQRGATFQIVTTQLQSVLREISQQVAKHSRA